MDTTDAELYPEGGGIDYETADIYEQADFLHRYCKRRDYTDLPMLEYMPHILLMRDAIEKYEIKDSPTYHLLRSLVNLPQSEMEPAPLNLREQLYYADNPEKLEERLTLTDSTNNNQT